MVSETMSAYGIDNGAQEQYLEELGFKIHPHTYSVGPGTLKSMSRALDASPDYLLDRDGRRSPALGRSPILLRGYGCKTYGAFPSVFYFRGTTPSYDHSFPAVFAYRFADPGLLQSRQNPVTGHRTHMSGAEVDDGVMVGGIDDGELLFPSGVEE